jgi:hypothetical protein
MVLGEASDVGGHMVLRLCWELVPQNEYENLTSIQSVPVEGFMILGEVVPGPE